MIAVGLATVFRGPNEYFCLAVGFDIPFFLALFKATVRSELFAYGPGASAKVEK